MDVDCSLVVGCCGEDLALLCRDRGVALDQFGCNAAQRLDGQGQRCDVEQQDVVDLTGQNACLDSRADRDAFVRVDTLERLFAGDALDCFLNCRDTGAAADQDDLRDVVVGDTGVSHSLSHRLDRRVDEVLGQLVELGSGNVHVHVERTVLVDCDERQVDVRGGRAGEFFLGFLSRFLQSLERHLVLSQIDAVLLCELVSHVVEQLFIEVVAAQLVVAVGSQYFEDTIAEFHDGYVECAAAEVVDQDFLVGIFFVEAVCQCSSGRLVDDALDVEACDTAGVFGRLLLAVGEVCRNGDDCLCDRAAQICFCVSLQLRQGHRGDVLRCIVLAIDGHGVVFTHVTLDGSDRSFRIGDGLSLGGFADQTFTVLGKTDDGRCCSCTFRVCDDYGIAAFEYCDAAVGGPKVDADNFTHC